MSSNKSDPKLAIDRKREPLLRPWEVRAIHARIKPGGDLYGRTYASIAHLFGVPTQEVEQAVVGAGKYAGIRPVAMVQVGTTKAGEPILDPAPHTEPPQEEPAQEEPAPAPLPPLKAHNLSDDERIVGSKSGRKGRPISEGLAYEIRRYIRAVYKEEIARPRMGLHVYDEVARQFNMSTVTVKRIWLGIGPTWRYLGAGRKADDNEDPVFKERAETEERRLAQRERQALEKEREEERILAIAHPEEAREEPPEKEVAYGPVSPEIGVEEETYPREVSRPFTPSVEPLTGHDTVGSGAQPDDKIAALLEYLGPEQYGWVRAQGHKEAIARLDARIRELATANALLGEAIALVMEAIEEVRG